MAKDDSKKEREDDNLEQYGVWVKTGSDGIEEMEPESIEIEDDTESDQLYITEEEEDLLNELHSSEEEMDESLSFEGLEEEDFDLDSLDADGISDDLDFSDVASIEETIEDSLPDFDDLPDQEPHPLEDAMDKLEAQTELLEESSRQLNILEKIESELTTIRDEIKDLKDEISTIKMVPRTDSQGEEAADDEQPAGFFDDNDLDETIALTGDELDNILDGTLLEEEEEINEEIPEDEEIQLQPEETLPEDEYQDESDLLSDTSLEIPEDDPALSMLTNAETEESLPVGEEETDTLEITIDDQGEVEEEEISLDNLLDGEDIDIEEVSFDDMVEEEPAVEMTNEAEEVMSIDGVEPSDEVEEIDIEDMVEASPDDDLIIEEVNLDDLGIDISDFDEEEDDVLEESADMDTADMDTSNAETAAAEELDETIFDEGEEVSFEDMDGDIVFEDESSFSETDEIESVDLSEFSEESIEMEEIDSLDDIELDEVSLESIEEEDLTDSMEPLSDLAGEDSAIEFEDASLDDFLESVDMEEDDSPLDFPSTEEEPEFPLPPAGSDDDTLIDDFSREEEEVSLEGLDDILDSEGEGDFTQIDMDEIIREEEEIPEAEELVIEEEIPEAEELVIEEEIPEAEELVIEEEIPEAEELVIEEEIPEAEELVIEEEIPEAEELVIEEEIPETEELIIEEEIPEVEELVIEEEITEEEEMAGDRDASLEDETILDESPTAQEEFKEEDLGFDIDESILTEGEEEEEDFLDLDLDLDLDEDLSLEDSSPDPFAAEPESSEEISESFSIEIEDGTSDEIDLSSDEIETAPVEDLSIDEENIDDILDNLSMADDLGEFGETSDENTGEEPEQLTDLPEDLPEEESSPLSDIEALRNSSELNSLPYDLKEEIKEVLTYMDQLLEALPEDKIQEFARSEHFEVYKKIFTELGIAK